MAVEVTYKSDVDDEVLEEKDVVILTVARQNTETIIVLSEDQLGELMEESETLGALILRD